MNPARPEYEASDLEAIATCRRDPDIRSSVYMGEGTGRGKRIVDFAATTDRLRRWRLEARGRGTGTMTGPKALSARATEAERVAMLRQAFAGVLGEERAAALIAFAEAVPYDVADAETERERMVRRLTDEAASGPGTDED